MRKKVLCYSSLGLALLLQCLTPPSRALACVVGTGTGASCTEAALTACLPGGGSFDGTVTFNCGGAATITVTSTKGIFSADTTIDGGSLITISGGNSVGVFEELGGVKFTVQNLTIANGSGSAGGGITNLGGGSLTVTNSTFSGNYGTLGGGISNSWGGSLTVTNSTFSGNSATLSGGGITNSGGGAHTVTNSTFSGNSASEGGGISNSGPLTVTNSTFSGNSASAFGGGIFSRGPLTVTNSTFSGNSASIGGGIHSGGATLTVTNTIFANSTSGHNCGGAITNGGHNIEDGTTCGWGSGSGSLSSTDPRLDPAGLANNGGPTQTIALQADSPAINAGNDAVCAAPPVNSLDQRGYGRPGGSAANCSIGAYEYNALPSSFLSSAIAATDTCIPVSDTSIFSPTGGFALIGPELISYTGLGTSCSGASAARASAGTAATAGVLTGVTRNLNGQGGAHAAGTTVTPSASACVGDCNGNGSVTVDEILTMVNIALGNTAVTTCEPGDTNHDGQITVDEILSAVNNALNGCGG